MSDFSPHSLFHSQTDQGTSVRQQPQSLDPRRNEISVGRTKIQAWSHQLNDALFDCSTGDMRDFERGMIALDELQREMEDLLAK